MPPFLRENAVIILGLTLPLLLILALLLVRTLENSGPPPAYEAVFAMHYQHQPYVITVKNERLEVTVTPSKNLNLQEPLIIYHYNPATNITTHYDIRGDEVTEPTPYTLPAELANLRLNPDTISPDGFRLVRNPYRNHSFFSEIFSPIPNNQIILRGPQRKIVVPSIAEQYRREQFIGWVIPHE